MSVTLSTLRTKCYDILREEENSSAYPYTFVDQLLNASQQRICTGRVVNPLNKEEVIKWVLPFLNTDKYYSNVATTSLTAAATVGATTLTVGSTTNFDSTGTLYILGNIVTYTWKTSTTFTGVSGVLFAFLSGSEVSVAFSLPTDYASVINVVYKNQYKLPAQNYDDIFENLNSSKGRNNRYNNRNNNDIGSHYLGNAFYSIKDNTYLIVFNANQTGDMIRFRYEKLPTTMTLTTDTATISNDIFALWTIPYIAIGELLYNRGEEGRGAEILNFWLGQVREMYNYYNNTSYEDPSGSQYKVAKAGRRLNI